MVASCRELAVETLAGESEVHGGVGDDAEGRAPAAGLGGSQVEGGQIAVGPPVKG